MVREWILKVHTVKEAKEWRLDGGWLKSRMLIEMRHQPMEGEEKREQGKEGGRSMGEGHYGRPIGPVGGLREREEQLGQVDQEGGQVLRKNQGTIIEKITQPFLMTLWWTCSMLPISQNYNTRSNNKYKRFLVSHLLNAGKCLSSMLWRTPRPPVVREGVFKVRTIMEANERTSV